MILDRETRQEIEREVAYLCADLQIMTVTTDLLFTGIYQSTRKIRTERVVPVNLTVDLTPMQGIEI
jgi:hypothetical protein